MGEQVAARLKWGCSSVGRAPALQAGGQEFESLRLHLTEYSVKSQSKKWLTNNKIFDTLHWLSKVREQRRWYLENCIL